MVPIDAGIEGRDQGAGAVDAQLVPNPVGVDRADSRRNDVEPVRGSRRAQLVIRARMHDRFDQLRLPVGLDLLDVGAPLQFPDGFFGRLHHDRVRDPVARVSEHLSVEHGLVQPCLERSLGLLLSLQRVDDGGVTLETGGSLRLQLGIQRDDRSFLEIRDHADRLVRTSRGELSFERRMEGSRPGRRREQAHGQSSPQKLTRHAMTPSVKKLD